MAAMQSVTLLWLLLFAVTGSAFAAEPEKIADDNEDFVSDSFPYPMNYVYDRIALQFSSEARAYYEDYSAAIYDLPGDATSIQALSPKAHDRFLAFPIVRPNKFYVFYGAYPNMQRTLQDITPASTVQSDNPALERYAQLSPEVRRNDLYLWSPDTPFWYSEYRANNRLLPFRSYFIVHLSAQDSNSTKVEIIEDNPVVEMGRKLSVDAHGVVHQFDIRDVPPTTSDRKFLLSCIHQFIDRRVPGRHWFNCKTPAELALPPEPAPTPFTTP